MTRRIELRPLSDSTRERVAGIGLGSDQAEFVPSASLALRLTNETNDSIEHESLAILVQGHAIGLCVLSAPVRNPEVLFLGGFQIEPAEQGKGFGRAALDACISRVRARHRECRRLVLTVDPRNATARRLYESAGFRTRGERVSGEIVYGLDFRTRPESGSSAELT